MLAALCFALSIAFAEPPGEVRQAIGDAQMNWTTLTLETSRSSRGSGVDISRSTIEYTARQALNDAIQRGLSPLQVTADLTLSQLFNQGKLGHTLHERSKLWSVAESRYYRSGKVEVLAEVSVFEILKPWMHQAAPRGPDKNEASEFTGLILDNRANYTSLCYAPRILDNAGHVLFDGHVWRSRATHVSPVVFVSDLAHPQALRVGEKPLVVRPDRMRGMDYLLNELDSAAVHRAFDHSLTLGSGTVVVLVKP